MKRTRSYDLDDQTILNMFAACGKRQLSLETRLDELEKKAKAKPEPVNGAYKELFAAAASAALNSEAFLSKIFQPDQPEL